MMMHKVLLLQLWPSGASLPSCHVCSTPDECCTPRAAAATLQVLPLQVASLTLVCLPWTVPRLLDLQAANPAAVLDGESGTHHSCNVKQAESTFCMTCAIGRCCCVRQHQTCMSVCGSDVAWLSSGSQDRNTWVLLLKGAIAQLFQSFSCCVDIHSLQLLCGRTVIA